MAAKDTFNKLWAEASALKRGLIVGVPAVVIIAAVTVAIVAAAGGGGGKSNAQVIAPTSTDTPAPSATSVPVPTDTPASAGLQANTAPPADAGSHTTNSAPVQHQSGTGPGSAQGTGMSLTIGSINVNAPVYSRSVGTNGQMGNPSGPTDVVWYDFSENWPQYGGYPGQPGANAVFAGHVDYIHYGPAVFWSLKDLQPGDQVTVNTPNGAFNYAIDWSEWADPSVDFTQFVTQTGSDSITLVTCVGSFSAGHYSNRLIVRGHRI